VFTSIKINHIHLIIMLIIVNNNNNYNNKIKVNKQNILWKNYLISVNIFNYFAFYSFFIKNNLFIYLFICLKTFFYLLILNKY